MFVRYQTESGKYSGTLLSSLADSGAAVCFTDSRVGFLCCVVSYWWVKGLMSVISTAGILSNLRDSRTVSFSHLGL